MISLNDAQLKTVMAAAHGVPHEKRSQFLERIAAMLRLRGRGDFDDADVADAVQQALTGLIQQPVALSPVGSRCGFASAPEMLLGSIRADREVSQPNVLMILA
jgi:hypothetical protein